MPDRTLVMFAKYPEAGKVKTRLALGTANPRGAGLKDVRRRGDETVLGNTTALEWSSLLYEAFVQDRVAAHVGGDYRFMLGVSGPEDPARFALMIGHPVPALRLQGESMGHLLRSAFQQLLPGRVLITASDYPVLPAKIIADAFAALDASDVVLVPAHDGAYNLIGMRTWHDIFDITAWSTGRELAETEALLAERGISRTILRQHVIRDVDTMADVQAIMRTLDADAAPRTAVHLALWQQELALAV